VTLLCWLLDGCSVGEVIFTFYWATPGSMSCSPGRVESRLGLAARRRRRSAVKTAVTMRAVVVYDIVLLVEDFMFGQCDLCSIYTLGYLSMVESIC
jgi:hypothetical protein